MAAKDELTTGVSELSDLGWEQHQFIARTMYNNFTDVFKNGGDVFAISSLSGRCVLSMASFCQELTQCNPKIEIREQSARKTLDGVVPTDRQNPVKHNYPKGRNLVSSRTASSSRTTTPCARPLSAVSSPVPRDCLVTCTTSAATSSTSTPRCPASDTRV